MRKELLLVAMGLSTGLGLAPGARAQTAAKDDALEEVVVTAEKRATNLQRTPTSIQVYTGEQLKKDSKKRLDDIMNGVVGVNVQGSQVGSSFYMRGVPAGGGGPPGGGPNQSAVAVLIDGVYQNRSEVVRGGSVDLAQVEVMRGTQSTTVGASALAGAVSLVSNNPTFNYEGTGSVDFGNYNLKNIEGVVNVPLSGDQAIRVAYSTQKRDGYLSSGAGDSDLDNLRFKYRWQLTDNLNSVFTASHQTIGGNGVSDGVLAYTGHWVAYNAANPQAPVPTYTGSCAYAAGPPGSTVPVGGTIAVMGCPFSQVLVRDDTPWWARSNPWDDGYPANLWPNHPYRDTTINNYQEEITWNTAIGTVTVTPSASDAKFLSVEPPRGNSWMSQDQTQKTQQFEARIASPNSSKVEWVAGVYYYKTDVYGTFEDINSPGNSGMGPTDPTACNFLVSAATATTQAVYNTHNCYGWNWGDGKQETDSAYANMTIPVIADLRLIAGLRYSRDKKSYKVDLNAANSPGGDLAGTSDGPLVPYSTYGYSGNSATWSAFQYRVGAEYDVAPQSMAYLSYQTGYQPGAIAAATPLGSPKLTLQQYTLGIKNRFFEDKLQLNAEGFYSTFHNQTIAGGLPSVGLSANDCNGVGGPPGSPTAAAVTDTTGCLVWAGTAVVPNAVSKGLDLEASFLPTADDRIDLTYEYLRSTYNSDPNVTPYTGAQILSIANVSAPDAAQIANAAAVAAAFNANLAGYNGLILQNAPEHSLNFTYQHKFRMGDGSSLSPRVQAFYKSKYWTEGGGPASLTIAQINRDFNSGTADNAIQGGYTLYDAYLAWENASGKVNASLYMHNIANKPIMQNYGGTYVTLAAPRTFGVSVNASF
ncbi:MAG TPA: TonB-dependent receptor [Steroidobacteraceae bacterium]|nr:TonB-dependent receptor [Steroidobacteraceae bacterium]